jgi:hypothetical protein
LAGSSWALPWALPWAAWSIGSGRARGALWAGLVLRGCGGIGTRRTRRRVGGLGQRE